MGRLRPPLFLHGFCADTGIVAVGGGKTSLSPPPLPAATPFVGGWGTHPPPGLPLEGGGVLVASSPFKGVVGSGLPLVGG